MVLFFITELGIVNFIYFSLLVCICALKSTNFAGELISTVSYPVCFSRGTNRFSLLKFTRCTACKNCLPKSTSSYNVWTPLKYILYLQIVSTCIYSFSQIASHILGLSYSNADKPWHLCTWSNYLLYLPTLIYIKSRKWPTMSSTENEMETKAPQPKFLKYYDIFEIWMPK